MSAHLCACGCGNELKPFHEKSKRIRYAKYVRGHGPHHSFLKDISGQRFGRTTAQWPAAKSVRRRTYFLCCCDCGTLHLSQRDNLVQGTTGSCGCLNIERSTRDLVNASLVHGHTRNRRPTPEYRAYSAAKNRCNNPNNKEYPYYGGRGILFLFSNFEEFYAEVGSKPEPKEIYSIDRIFNDGHYTHGNLRWATDEQQSANRRSWERGAA